MTAHDATGHGLVALGKGRTDGAGDEQDPGLMTVMASPGRLVAGAIVALALLVLLVLIMESRRDVDVVAEVNGEPIVLQEVESRFESVTRSPLFADELEADEDGTVRVEVKASILTELIRAELWEQGAEDLSIDVTDADVEARREQQIEEVGGEEAFQEQVERYALAEDDLMAWLRNLVVRERVEAHVVDELEASVEGELHPREVTAALQRWAAEQVRDANIEVDPRFGTWDAAAGRVDPSAALDDGRARDTG